MNVPPKVGQMVLDEHGRSIGRAVAVSHKGGVVVMDDDRAIPMREFYRGRYRADRHTPPQPPHEVAAIRDAAMLRHGSAWSDYVPYLRRGDKFVDRRVKVWAEMRAAGLSYPQIGQAFGTAHTTVFCALQRAKQQAPQGARAQ